jgi:phage terminase large subunit
MIPQLKLQPKQIQAVKLWNDEVTEEILYGGSKGCGKSFLGCAVIFMDAMMFPGTHYFIARHNLNDLKKYTTPSVIEVFNTMNLAFTDYVTYNGQDNIFVLSNGSRVFYIDCAFRPSDPSYHRFGSLQFTRGWFEETGQIDSLAIDNLSVAVGRWKNSQYKLKRKVLMTCNPNKGYAYNNFYLPAKEGSLPEYRRFIQAHPADNRYLTPDYIEALRRLPEVERERLLFGNWEYDSDPTTMIGFEAINDLFTNEFVRRGTKRIVGDIARYGSDRAIITVWDGLILIDYLTFDTSSMVELQNAITALRIKYNVQNSEIIVDAGGMGAGIVDNLHCKGFDAGSSPTKTGFLNLKAECGYKLAELAGEIWVKCPLPDKEIEMIRQELAMLKTYQADTDGKLRILPKEKIKEHIGRSPDWLDVFIMRMWFEIKDRGVSHQTWHLR